MTLLKLPVWHKRWLYASMAVLLLTGLLWIALHYGQDEEALPSRWEPWLMRLHGLAGFAALLALGAVLGQHVPTGWKLTRRHRRPRQRGTGLILCALLAFLASTAYALYYFAPEGLRGPLGLSHAAVGLLALPLWWIHRHRRRQ